MASKRYAALADIKARLAYITTGNEFNTDAGLHVTMGEVYELGPDDPQLGITVNVGDAAEEFTGSLTNVELPVEITAYIPASTVDPLLLLERIIEDIKWAIEIDDEPGIGRFAGDAVDHGTLPTGVNRAGTRSYPRQPGASIVGASVTYMLSFQEPWGQP